MELGRVLSLFVAMLALAYGLSVAATNWLAAACLIQFSILTAAEHDSARVQSLLEGHEAAFASVKMALLLAGLLLLW
ncbi:hypothetical protein C491_20756 [Natronococcus amylolyticus DSM 10524]|uniref:Uncharacterized protein n=1 Tax=Natronococcus amylolyticus DSM 10524 TaxID=1227497 RepID=L9WZI3_9EURY|nr:hypothetical protein [Natronococcus amylolyticus]ELY53778.1 hypothetical protein C491_20756 [Natronococcus amylolyticus DSM 10524]